MALQLLVVGSDGERRVIEVEPGVPIQVQPGDSVTLLNPDEVGANVRLERVGNTLTIHVGDESIALQGFYEQAGQPPALVFEDSGGTQVIAGGADEPPASASYLLPPSEGLGGPESSFGSINGLGGQIFSPLFNNLQQVNGDSSSDPLATAGDEAAAIEIFAGSLAPQPAIFTVEIGAPVREGALATFTVVRSGNLNATASVDFATVDGTATGDVDFVSQSGTLTFGPGQLTADVVVQILSDTPLADDGETFSLELSNADVDDVIEIAQAQATITNNDPAVAVDDMGIMVLEGATSGDLTATLLSNDSDPDAGDSFTIISVNTAGTLGAVDFSSVFYTASEGAFGGLGAGQTATDTFTYTIIDGGNETSTATVTITIVGENDGPTAVDDNYATDEVTALNSPALTGVLSNDTDPEMDMLMVSASDTMSAQGAAVSVNGDGSFAYDPTGSATLNALAAGEMVVDTFSYTVDDGSGGTDIATVNITVTGVNDPPTADNDTVTVSEDDAATDVTAILLAGDTDPDASDVLTVSAIDATGTVGVVNLVGNVVTYDPNGAFESLAAGETAMTTFDYTVSDGNGGTSNATVTVTINGQNDAPTATLNSYATDEDTALVVGANNLITQDTGNGVDSDPDTSDMLMVSSFDALSALGATVIVNATGTFSYDPTTAAGTQGLGATESATDTFTYTVSDGNGGTDTATVSIALTGINDAPTAVLDTPTVNKDFAFDIPVLSNDIELDTNDVLTVVSVDTMGTIGLVTINMDNTINYDPNGQFPGVTPGMTGSDSFTYTIDDGNGGTDTATVNVTITANNPPTANPDSGATNEDTALNVVAGAGGVLDNDTDVEGNLPLAVVSFDAVSTMGAVVNVNADGSYSYDPTAAAAIQALADGANAMDTFTYSVRDDNGAGMPLGGISVGTVTITVAGVNDLPTATADAYTTDEDTALVVGANNVITQDTGNGMDSDPDVGDMLTVSNFDPLSVQGGTVNVNADGTFTYDPNGQFETLAAGAMTTDSFTYTLSDGNGGTSVATVTMTITGVNDAPMATALSQVVGYTEGAATVPLTDIVVTEVDTGDMVTARLTLQDTSTGVLTVSGGATYDGGTGIWEITGTQAAVNAALAAVSFTPNTDNDINTTITTHIEDGAAAGPADGVINLNVMAVNDAPTATANSYATDEDTALVVGANNLITQDTGNGVDSDPDTGDMLTAVPIVAGASALGATVTVNADGTFSYDPTTAAGTQGLGGTESTTDTFTYTVSDGNGGTDTATVSIALTGINDDPTAVLDSPTVNKDFAFDIPVLGNDIEIDTNDVLTVISVDTTGTIGLVTINMDNTINYDPNGQFPGVTPGMTGSDSFTYTIDDGNGGTDTATVNVTITANNPPTANPDFGATGEDTPLAVAAGAGGVLDNDTDLENNLPLVITGFDAVSTQGAAVVVNADGSYSYDPTGSAALQGLTAGATVMDTFTYSVRDDDGGGMPIGGTSVGTVTITVTGVNDAPTAGNDAVNVNEDDGATDVTATLLAGDTDPDTGETATLVVSAIDTTGTTGQVLLAGNTVTYNPNGAFESLVMNATAMDTFTYTVMDAQGATDTATVTVTITGQNDAPTADDDTVNVNEDDGATDVTATLLAGDTDPDTGETATLAVSAIDTTGTTGLATLVGGVVSYNPNGAFESLVMNATAMDTFTYTVMDAQGATDTATVTVTITGQNDGPTADDDTVNVNEDDGAADVTATLLAGDTDPDTGETATLAVSAIDTTGTTGLATLVGGVVSYNPNGAFESLAMGATAMDTFAYTVMDAQGATDTATVTVTITGQNDGPTADDDTVNVNEDDGAADVTATLLAGDTDPDTGETATLAVSAIDTTGTTGLATLVGGVVSYNPNGAFESLAMGATAMDTFGYTVSDGNGGTDTATVTVTITGQNDGPTADNDTVNVNEDDGAADVTATLLAGDTDPDTGETATLAVSAIDTTGTTGLATLVGGVVSYNPNGAFESLVMGATAMDTFTYTVMDAQGATDTATVTVTITGQNDGPTADNDAVAVNEDDGATDVTATLLAGDTDPDTGETATLVVSAIDTTGTTGLATLVGGVVSYNPNGAFESLAMGATATDTFTYTVMDAQGATDTATVTVTITGQNDGPTANDDIGAGFGTNNMTAFTTGNVLTNDTDPDAGDTLSVVAVNTTGTLGLVTNNLDGTFGYDPNGQFPGGTGTDTFTYTMQDVLGSTSMATVTITIDPNAPPNANPDFGATDEDTPLAVTAGLGGVLDNDDDLEMDPFNIIASDNMSTMGAVVAVNNVDGSYSYDPTGAAALQALSAGATAMDTFTYSISDGIGTSIGTVTITVTGVNDGPTADNDTVNVNEDDGATDVTATLLAGDIDPDTGETATLVVSAIDTTGTTGQVLLAGNTVTYNPNGAFESLVMNATAMDTFTYTVMDAQGATDTATVTVTITGQNDGPTADNDTVNVNEDDGATDVTATLLAGDTDPDTGETATLAVSAIDTTGTTGLATLVGGVVSYNPNGGFESLAMGATAMDTFTYTVMDAQGATDTATVTVTITGQNDGPTADNDTVNVNEDDGAADVTATLLAGDTDPDTGETATLAVSAIDTTGTTGLATLVGGVVSYNPNGGFESLAMGATAMDTFTYTVMDAQGATDTATVTVTITGQNDGPTADDDAVNVNEDDGATDVTATLLAGDTDPDTGETATLAVSAIDTTGTTGLATLVGGVVSYNPNGAFESLAMGATAMDTFTYTVMDAQGATDTATVTVTITGQNDAPTADDDGVAINADDPATDVTATLLAGDTDDTGDVLTVTAIDTTGTTGLATLVGGVVSYNPNGQFDGLAPGATAMDTFTYTVSDPFALTDTATVTVTITGANVPPVADNDNVAANEDDGAADVTATLLAGDTDVDPGHQAALVVSAIDTTGTTGQVLLAGNTVTYNPNGAFESLVMNATAMDTFTYTVMDPLGATDTATVTVTITGQNDGPTADNDTVNVNEDDGATDVTATLLAGDTDPDTGETATLAVSAIDTTGTTGLATLVGGVVSYNPNGGFESLAMGATAMDTFTYTVMDAQGATDTATVTVTITGQNDGPTADDDAVNVNEDDGATDVTATLLAGDTDPDTGETATLVVSAIDTTGTTGQVLLASNTVTYNPNGAFESLVMNATAMDTFTYTVMDAQGATDTATVTVTITGQNDGPTADNDTVNVNEDDGAADVTATLLAGDTDPDTGETATLAVSAIDTTGTTGLATLVGGVVSYNPNGAFESLAMGATAMDTFTYTVMDAQGATDTATVTVTITGQNDAPTANGELNQVHAYTEGDPSVSLNNIVVTDVDAGDTITAQLTLQDTSTGVLTTSGGATYNPVSGLWQIIGTVGVVNTALAAVAFTPNTNNDVSTTITTHIQDAAGAGPLDGVINLNVTAVNDQPIFTDIPGPLVTQLGTPISFDAGTADEISIDDVDAGAGLLSVIIDARNDNGTFTLGSLVGLTNVVGNNSAQVTFDGNLGNINNALDGLIYNATLDDFVDITINDNGFSGGPAEQVMDSIQITVTTNNPPNATPNVYTTDEDSSFTTGNVITNNTGAGADSDPDLDPLMVVAFDAVSVQGGLVNVNANGTFTYNPNGQFESLPMGGLTTDSFTYTISDGNGGTDTATVTMTVDGLNDAPVLNASATPVLNSIDAGSGAPGFQDGTLITALIDFAGGAGLNNVTDVDTGAVTGIAITARNGAANGSWMFSTDDGNNWSNLGTPTGTSSRLLAADGVTRIYFQPNAGFDGTINNAITFRAWDMNTGTNGGVANTNSPVGTSAFSTVTDTANITVNPAVGGGPLNDIQLSDVGGTVAGFRLVGAAGTKAGSGVAGAGDINGDGFADIVVGAPNAIPSESYILLGAANVTPLHDTLLTSLNGGNGGISVNRPSAMLEALGSGVGSGDINGDGLSDVFIGNSRAFAGAAGETFGLFGTNSPAEFAGLDNLNLTTLNPGNGGFQLVTNFVSTAAGLGQINGIGDFNGDGYEDLAVGARQVDIDGAGGSSQHGQGYVYFGRDAGSISNVTINNAANADSDGFDGTTLGFNLAGTALDNVGSAIGGRGDIDGDGYDDLFIGARNAGPSGAGEAYVVYGRDSGLTALDDAVVSSLGSADAADFRGISGSNFGETGTIAGDVNGDGLADIIVGAPDANPNGVSGLQNGGEAYVIFGKSNRASLDAVTPTGLNGADGFRFVPGLMSFALNTLSVSSAGDVNGDGFDDVIIGFPDAPNGGGNAGVSYVVYGGSSLSNINLGDASPTNDIDGTNGFSIGGETGSDLAGFSVSAAGDVNGDGFDDLIVGAPQFNPASSDQGAAYVILGGDFRGNDIDFQGPNITGTAAGNEALIGTSGNDAMLDGGGGAGDSLRSGAGDDTLAFHGGERRVDGGGGDDTLVLANNGQDLNLTSLFSETIRGIENIDLRGNGNNALTLDVRDLLQLSDTSNTLRVLGDAGDIVNATLDTWIDGGVAGGLHSYTFGNATLLIETDVTQNVTV